MSMNVSLRSDLPLRAGVMPLRDRLGQLDGRKDYDDERESDGGGDADEDASKKHCPRGAANSWSLFGGLSCNCEKVLILLFIVACVAIFLFSIDGTWLANEIYRAFQWPLVRRAKKQGYKLK
jgi:hypothetical protein